MTLIGILLSGNIPDLFDLFLNFTGLFGFLKWDTYFSVGAWSIGNELVFYVFFPIFLFLSRSYKSLMILLSVLIFIAYMYFAFFLLSKDLPLMEQWTNYVNPLNQVFLFLSGFLIGLFFKKTRFKNWHLFIVLFTGLMVFNFYPVSGDPINLVTGYNRIVLSICCIIICAAIYKISVRLPSFIHKPLVILGVHLLLFTLD